jgi:hypothetical protein
LISGSEPFGLYDLSTDPAENVDRSATEDLPEAARQLLRATFPRPPDPETEGIGLSAQDLEHLRALGYVR